MSPVDNSAMSLRDYVAVLRRRKTVILLAVAAVVASALIFSFLQKPVYEADARVLLQRDQSLFGTSSPGPMDAGSVQTEIQVMRSQPVRDAVRERLGFVPSVSFRPVASTSVVQILARNPRPSRAAEVANIYAEEYVSYRQRQTVDRLTAASQELQHKVESLDRQIAELSDRLASVPVCTPTSSPEACAQRIVLEQDRSGLVNQVSPFRSRLDQLDVDVSLTQGGPQIVTSAAAPSTPVQPRPVRNGLVAVGIGLVFGVALAFFVDHLDDSVKSKEDLEGLVRDVPVVGMIPLVTGWKNRKEARNISSLEPNSPAAEAYRTLRTSVQFLGLDQALRVIQITSPSAGEGKTTTTANLALALARAGRRVVVVSCDLRRPRIHEFFGLSNRVGFTSVLLGDTTLTAALQQIPNEERLMLLASGQVPPNPSELLASRRTMELLNTLKSHADIVLVDAPPVLPVTDAAVLASKAEGVLLVASAGLTTKKQVIRSVELLRQVRAPLIGTVLNAASTEAAYAYSYYDYRPGEGGNGKVPETALDELTKPR